MRLEYLKGWFLFKLKSTGMVSNIVATHAI
jgi:hypothetical protein